MCWGGANVVRLGRNGTFILQFPGPIEVFLCKGLSLDLRAVVGPYSWAIKVGTVLAWGLIC